MVSSLLLALCCAALAGENYKNFPGAPLDERTMRAQDRVEALYENGEYSRALLIYEKDLAPKGDKYAQYVVGYMYLNGKGVAVDKPRALAWYRLAAERDDPQLVQVRDALGQALTTEEIARSNEIFVGLWRAIGDNRLLINLIRDDLSTLRARTGTRIPGAATGQLTVVNVPGGGERYYQAIEERIETRLEYLKSNVEIVDIDLGSKDEAVRVLETDLRRELAALELP
jgi:hypothetical protein